MLRLSQRAWNNVIIVTMLIMIWLFNVSSDFLNGEFAPDAIIPLLPQGSVILRIEYDQAIVERVGTGWRLSSHQQAGQNPLIAEPELHQLVSSWQQATIEPIGKVSLTSPLVAVVWLAGESKGSVFQFMQQGEQTWVAHNQQVYLLNQPSLNDLFLGKVN